MKGELHGPHRNLDIGNLPGSQTIDCRVWPPEIEGLEHTKGSAWDRRNLRSMEEDASKPGGSISRAVFAGIKGEALRERIRAGLANAGALFLRQ